MKRLGLLGTASVALPALQHPLFTTASQNVLVLGGTNFLGPAIVAALNRRGHQVTLFNRGFTNPGLFPELKKIRGDREKGAGGYKNLIARASTWDVVIDVWPQNPQLVSTAIDAVKDHTGHYIYVSSIAVYHDFRHPGMDETAAVRKGSQYQEGNYNLNKVLCEKLVEQHFPDNFTIVRPGAIVGDRDPGPFGLYLLNRLASRKEMLAPDSNDPVQLIDAKDIGDFLTRCCEQSLTGYYNLVGPKETLGYRDLLERSKKVLSSPVDIIWMDPEFLVKEAKVEPFSDIPFWIPLALDPEPAFYQISNEKALKAGLEFSTLEDTVKRSYDSFHQGRFIPEKGSDLSFGIPARREEELIARWKQR